MNEQVARNVVLVRAIETTDQKYEILSQDDRMYASRSAKELAQWQASDAKSAVTPDHFLQQRSEQIVKRIAERTPAFATFVKRRHGLGALTLLLPALALLLGAGLDRITDPHRVDLLSAPLLLIIGWNLLVYLGLLLWAVLPAPTQRAPERGWIGRLAVGKASLPRKLPHTLSAALFSFMAEWSLLSAKLSRARLARSIHLSAAMFALGAMLSLYARGLLSLYAAGWESTFLDAGQVHALLSVLFAPAVAVFPLQAFSVADIEALRFGASSSPVAGALWVHLYAATLLLLVVVPRLVLAAAASWRASRLAKKFPLDLEAPYFLKLGEKLTGSAGTLRVLPYSFTVDTAREKGLALVAEQLVGENARVVLQPALAYGEDMPAMLHGATVDEKTTLTAALFNLAATPETENHGAFLDYLLRHSPRGLTVLIDESAYLERAGKERIAERVALWREFCGFHQVSATIVNLLTTPVHHPEKEAP